MAESASQSSVPEGVDPLNLRQCIITTMREQQADFLRQAAENTERIVQQQRDNSVRDTLDSIQSASTNQEGAPIKDAVNRLNFDFASQVQTLWRKAETVINEGADAHAILDKGKLLCKKHLKLLRIADKWGWDAAATYRGDQLASDEEDYRRLTKAIKSCTHTADRSADSGGGRSDKRPAVYSPKGADKGRRSDRGNDALTCWRCGALGHITYDCPLSFKRRGLNK